MRAKPDNGRGFARQPKTRGGPAKNNRGGYGDPPRSSAFIFYLSPQSFLCDLCVLCG
jgi:hypothetical protein